MPDDNTRAQLRQLRRRTLPPLILGWAALITATAIGDLLALAILPLLGVGTFNFITGWPVRSSRGSTTRKACLAQRQSARPTPGGQKGRHLQQARWSWCSGTARRTVTPQVPDRYRVATPRASWATGGPADCKSVSLGSAGSSPASPTVLPVTELPLPLRRAAAWFDSRREHHVAYLTGVGGGLQNRRAGPIPGAALFGP